MKTQLELDYANFEKICKQAIPLAHPAIGEIINSILIKEFTTEHSDSVLNKYGIKNISEIKDDSMDFVFNYINVIIKDNELSDLELKNLKQLKRIFKINEGDFYNFRKNDLQKVLNIQLQKIYEDNVVNSSEALLNVGMQELFDLSYDQYQELSLTEIKNAVGRGAQLDDLDSTVNL